MQIFNEGVKGLMLEKLILSNIKNQIVNRDKIKKRKYLKKLAKRQRKQMLTKMFGKLRYILANLFGEWVLFTCNSKFYAQNKAAEPITQQPCKVINLVLYR